MNLRPIQLHKTLKKLFINYGAFDKTNSINRLKKIVLKVIRNRLLNFILYSHRSDF